MRAFSRAARIGVPSLCVALVAAAPAVGHGTDASARSASPKPEAVASRSTSDIAQTLSAVRAIAEIRIVSVSQMLSILAETPPVKSGEWEEMQPLLRSLAEAGIDANAIWFARTDGTYFTVDQGRVRATLSDRPYFPALMDGKEILGSLVISKSTGRRSVVIAHPVTSGGTVIGALGVSYSVDQLGKEIDRDLRLPEDVVFYALDAAGQTALHRDPALMFEYPSDMGDETLRAAVTRMLREPGGTVDYTFRGVRKRIVFERSAVLDWVFAVGVPVDAATN